jgi:hypothetical protein
MPSASRPALRLVYALAVVSACRVQSLPSLPPIPVYEITPTEERAGIAITPSTGRDPLAELGATKRVTLTSSNADARTLLLWLAQQAGVSIVVSPDVATRVSVSFTDVPAGEAMRAIISQAGLSVLASSAGSPWPPVVFHQLAVNINEASAETIAARFGVTRDMARWIVESRPRD